MGTGSSNVGLLVRQLRALSDPSGAAFTSSFVDGVGYFAGRKWYADGVADYVVVEAHGGEEEGEHHLEVRPGDVVRMMPFRFGDRIRKKKSSG